MEQLESRFDTIFELSNCNICIIDLKGSIKSVNAAFIKTLGYLKVNIINKMKISDLIHPEDKKFLSNCISKVLGGKTIEKQEFRLKNVDGDYIQFSSNLSTLDSRKNGDIICISQDLTEHKYTQRQIENRIHRQAMITKLGQIAINEQNLDKLFDGATRLLAEILNIEFTKVLELIPSANALFLRTGIGWDKGLVGTAFVDNNINSQAGYTLLTTKPVVVYDLKTERRFHAPKLLVDHHIISGMSVIIQGENKPFGILGAHTTKLRRFSDDDINFLRSVANILASAIARHNTEAELRESEEKYRTLTEQSLLGTTIIMNGNISFANKGISSILGYSSDELTSWDTNKLKDLINPEDLPEIVKAYKKCMNDNECIFQSEIRIHRKNGPYIWIQQYSKVIQLHGESALQTMIIDITERKKAETLLKSSLIEKEILLKEVHHRVKNNLQIIASLFILQEHSIKDEKLKKLLLDFQNRIKTMALIHEALYHAKDLKKINFSEYLENLVQMLFITFSIDPKQVSLKMDIDNIDLGLNSAIPCGLIVNELITNSLKYAFKGKQHGNIEVSLKRAENNSFSLEIFDNGVGFPKEVDVKNSNSLGLKIVSTLTKQLKGNITVDRNNGTRFTIVWKE